jgi:hypothetical protein
MSPYGPGFQAILNCIVGVIGCKPDTRPVSGCITGAGGHLGSGPPVTWLAAGWWRGRGDRHPAAPVMAQQQAPAATRHYIAAMW